MNKLKNFFKNIYMYNIENETFRSIVYLIIVIASILFPLLYQCIDALLAWDFAKIHIKEEFLSGNFCLYTISLITPMLYVVDAVLHQEYSAKVIKIPFLETFFAILIAIMVYINIYENQKKPFLIVVVSIGLFLWAISIAFRIHQFELRNNQSPAVIRAMNEEAIVEQMQEASSNTQPNSKKTNNGKKTGNLVDDTFDETEDFE